MKSKKGETVVVAYVPVPHAGYLKFFRTYSQYTFYILGEEFINEFPALVRHLPGVKPEEVWKMIRAMNIFPDVRVLDSTSLDEVRQFRVIMPDEDVSREFAEKYLDVSVAFDNCWRLRWDWGAIQAKRLPDCERTVSFDELDRAFMRFAFFRATRSPDWWRQIGALLVKNGRIILSAFNRHVPNEQSAYCYGDPRSNFDQGKSIEVSSSLHAEMGIISEAARRGIRMEGCDLYVTTFPCPPCAYALAYTGIKRLYYADGYSLIAGAETLQAKGVEIIHVKM